MVGRVESVEGESTLMVSVEERIVVGNTDMEIIALKERSSGSFSLDIFWMDV